MAEKVIVCDECGEAGGTLIRKGNAYVHRLCPHRPSALDPSLGLILPPPLEFPKRKERRGKVKHGRATPRA